MNAGLRQRMKSCCGECMMVAIFLRQEAEGKEMRGRGGLQSRGWYGVLVLTVEMLVPRGSAADVAVSRVCGINSPRYG